MQLRPARLVRLQNVFRTTRPRVLEPSASLRAVERWTAFVLRHRWAVLGVWVAAFLVSAWVSSGLSDLLTNRFSIPGSDTARAEKILHDEFGQRSDGAFQLVFRAGSGRSAEDALPE